MTNAFAKRTTIGSSDLSIYPFGLGGNTFGMTTDVEASEKVLDAFEQCLKPVDEQDHGGVVPSRSS